MLLPIDINTTMNWIGVKSSFKVKDNEVIYISWEDDKNWTEIYLEKKLYKMINWVYKILVLENNEDLPRRLVIAVPKKKLLVDYKCHKNEHFWNL